MIEQYRITLNMHELDWFRRLSKNPRAMAYENVWAKTLASNAYLKGYQTEDVTNACSHVMGNSDHIMKYVYPCDEQGKGRLPETCVTYFQPGKNNSAFGSYGYRTIDVALLHINLYRLGLSRYPTWLKPLYDRLRDKKANPIISDRELDLIWAMSMDCKGVFTYQWSEPIDEYMELEVYRLPSNGFIAARFTDLLGRIPKEVVSHNKRGMKRAIERAGYFAPDNEIRRKLRNPVEYSEEVTALNPAG